MLLAIVSKMFKEGFLNKNQRGIYNWGGLFLKINFRYFERFDN